MVDRPNVLIISSDQHNSRVMGCAGDAVVQTPNLDRLAASGVLLENLYCQAPLCAPSRMSFLTGILPNRLGVSTNEQMPSPAHPTYAHSAGAVGYRPYLSGKIHALGPDQLMGFAQRDVGDHGPNFRGGGLPTRGALAGAMGPGKISLQKIGVGQNAYEVRDEFAVEAVVSHLRRHAIEQTALRQRAPFFVQVGLMLPHQPYVARARDYARYAGRVGLPRVPAATTSADDHPFLRWWREATAVADGVPEEVVLKARAAYWAMVDRMDALIGRILDTLRELDMDSNTLVFYTSDHGDHVGEHGLWWKQTLLDPAAKVPGIMSWPGVIPSGVRSQCVAGLVDINATIIDAIGGPPLPRSTGVSMLETLCNGAEWPDTTFAEHCADRDQTAGLGNIDVPDASYQRMVRRGRYKYIDYGHQRPQLFDLLEDPDETIDRAGDATLADIESSLATLVRADWDPVTTQAETRTSLAEIDVIKNWARQVQPADRFRWTMKPEYNVLDEPESFHDQPGNGGVS